MTKKHFEMIAQALRNAGDHVDAKGREGVKATALILCGELRCINPRFDAGRFLTACGIEI